MKFDELVKKEAFTVDEVCQSGFDKLAKGKSDWVETPRSLKIYTIFNAWRKSGLLKTRRLELMAAFKIGEIFGKLNAQFKNESEWI